jgi:hypothetical protein
MYKICRGNMETSKQQFEQIREPHYIIVDEVLINQDEQIKNIQRNYNN